MFLKLLNIDKKNRSILKENIKHIVSFSKRKLSKDNLEKLIRRKNNLNGLFHCNCCMEKESTMHFCYMQAMWSTFDLYHIKYYV